MNAIVAIVESLFLMGLFPLFQKLWFVVARQDSDTWGGHWTWIWGPIGAVGFFMTLALCSIFLKGHHPPAEFWIPLGVGAYLGFAPYLLSFARTMGIGRSHLGQSLGFAAPTPRRRP